MKEQTVKEVSLVFYLGHGYYGWRETQNTGRPVVFYFLTWMMII